MKVFLNHQEICVGSRVTLRDLLAGQSLTADGSTVAVNNRVITKEEWRETFLSNGDKVTVIKTTY
ncbi:sulfur carrier protein ThiS [Coprobacter tertius]|uniref:Sulfur carrier protein ThiS n=1 Tax=Coprobacter tertius TaxID=2944915 RepID=A0ABT1MHZ0_9BACT|nr:sulfur carrier protein ThiS [Coprobacter tertius]MCP9612016.1 sulfur carrier protein ThiS [Coprobacter tertius]